jgi:hypothetical protein
LYTSFPPAFFDIKRQTALFLPMPLILEIKMTAAGKKRYTRFMKRRFVCVSLLLLLWNIIDV